MMPQDDVWRENGLYQTLDLGDLMARCGLKKLGTNSFKRFH